MLYICPNRSIDAVRRARSAASVCTLNDDEMLQGIAKLGREHSGIPYFAFSSSTSSYSGGCSYCLYFIVIGQA